MPKILMGGEAFPVASLGPGPHLSPIIVGGGYIQDGSDDSYVDSVRRVYDYFPLSQLNLIENTSGYQWDFIPVESVPPAVDTDYHIAKIRAKIELVKNDIAFPPSAVQTLSFYYYVPSTTANPTVVGSFDIHPANPELPVGVPTWIEIVRDQALGTVTFGASYEALRTGFYPGYGPVRIAFGFGGASSVNAPNSIGDEMVVRLYELHITLRPGGWVVGEEQVAW